MQVYSKEFIALDLETTHLDLKEGRIMEVGAAEMEIYFDEAEKQIKVRFSKTFDKLVNPETVPSQTALALTGITFSELQSAPAWGDVKKDLEKFLGDATILGQNVVFDLDFLKNQGIRKKYPFVDTLDIALTFLPLFPVHSLEYLSQEFEAPAAKAHRALADSKNTAYVLAGLLNEFLSFSSSLQKEIRAFLDRSGIAYRDLFLDLPQITLSPPPPFSPGRSPEGTTREGINDSVFSPLAGEDKESVPFLMRSEGEFLTRDWPDKTIVSLPLGLKREAELLASLSSRQIGGLAVPSHGIFLENVPERQLIPDPGWALCTKRLEWFRNQQNISDQGLKVLIKLAIFRQSIKSLDLSRVKWGNLDRGIIPLILADPIACQSHKCEYLNQLRPEAKSPHFMSLTGFFALVFAWKVDFGEQRLLFFDLPRIEEELVEAVTETWNLRGIRRRFMLLFPLEKGLPSRLPNLPTSVAEILNELDLFFGILHLIYLKKDGEFAENLVIDEAERSTERFRKLFHPTQKLISKLGELNDYFKALSSLQPELRDEITSLQLAIPRLVDFLQRLFVKPAAQSICWLKFNSEWVDLNICPAEIAKDWQRLHSVFSSLTIVETELPDIALNYYQGRLGVTDYKISHPKAFGKKEDLEILISKVTPATRGQVELCENLTGRTLVIVPNESKLSEFIEIFTSHENQKRVFLAYKFSGNLTLLRSKLKNMGPEGILLLTLNAFLKNFQNLPRLASLVLARLPFEAPTTRPDLLAGAQNRFADHALPRSVTILHTILSRFAAAASDNAKIYLLDSRILTDYDQTFLKYLQELPNAKISTV